MRARNIKPGFFENELLVELPPAARLIFVGMWCMADREGRLEDRPKKIKLQILPYDSVDVDEYLNDLQRLNFITRYSVNGSKYIQIQNFLKHQHPHQNESPSIIPPMEIITAEQIDIAQALMQERITEEDAGITRDKAISVLEKAGLVYMDESTSHHVPKSLLPCISMVEHTPADSLNPDSLNPDSLNPDSKTTPPSPLEGGERARVREADSNEQHEHCIPYSEIVGYLNQKTGKRFQSDDKKGTKTRRLIKLRWDQGFRLQDFKQVIDTKVEKWSQDDKMSDFLRPETLFGTKFESYLNECRSPPENTMDGKLSKKGQATWRNIQALRQRERGENGQGEIRQEPCWPGRDVREGVVGIPGDDLSAGHGPIQR